MRFYIDSKRFGLKQCLRCLKRNAYEGFPDQELPPSSTEMFNIQIF